MWIVTRGIIAPIRDATELALICSMIYYQYKMSLQTKIKSETTDLNESDLMKRIISSDDQQKKEGNFTNGKEVYTIQSH